MGDQEAITGQINIIQRLILKVEMRGPPSQVVLLYPYLQDQSPPCVFSTYHTLKVKWSCADPHH